MPSFSVIGKGGRVGGAKKEGNGDDGGASSSSNNKLSLVRIDDDDDASKNIGIIASSWIAQAENILMQQWPRGGPYREKILQSHHHAQKQQPLADVEGGMEEGECNSCYREEDYSCSSRATALATYMLPCSYLLIENDDGVENDGVVMGHGRLTECFESAAGNAVAATFVAIDERRRGNGYGAELMALLEKESVRLGYHYVYLWTRRAVVGFYERIGYAICERVSLKRPCLKSLRHNEVDTLEAMLSRKSQKAAAVKAAALALADGDRFDDSNGAARTVATAKKETVMLPPDDDDDERDDDGKKKDDDDFWLRKRLVERVGSIQIPIGDRIEEIEAFVARMDEEREDGEDEECDWYYRLLPLPWQAQIGPSCGLAALRMVREFFISSVLPPSTSAAAASAITVDVFLPDGYNQSCEGVGEQRQTPSPLPMQLPSLLGEAQERGYTKDGELFNINHLKDLAETVCGIDAKLWSTASATNTAAASSRPSLLRRIDGVLAGGGVFILPYDSKPRDYSPANNLKGQRAHYGIVVGILVETVGTKEEDDVDDATAPARRDSEGGSGGHGKTSLRLRSLDERGRNTAGILDDSRKAYLIVQHGLSRKLTIAAMDEFLESNRRLTTYDEAKYGAQDLDLKDRMVACKSRFRPSD